MIVVNGFVSEKIKRHLMAGGTHPMARRHGNLIIAGGDYALPAGYTELDYIGTTGSGSGSSGSGQYIDTEFRLNQDSRIVCELMYQGGSGGDGNNVYGARGSVSSNNFSMRVMDSWQFGYGDGTKTSGNVPYDTTNWHVIDHNKNIMYVDGVQVAKRDPEEFTTGYDATIGAIRASGVYYGKCLFRFFQIYDNGVLVREFIPCKNPDGVAGMYDTVNGKFHGNKGTGEFVTG